MTEYGRALFRKRSNKVSIAEKFKTEEIPFPPEFKSLRKNKKAWNR